MANSIVKMASVDKYVLGQFRNPDVSKLYHDGNHPLAVAFYHAAEQAQQKKHIEQSTNVRTA